MEGIQQPRLLIALAVCIIVACIYPHLLTKQPNVHNEKLHRLAEQKMQQSVHNLVQAGSHIVQEAKQIIAESSVAQPTVIPVETVHLPSDIVYGIINDQDIYRVKLGPFHDEAFAQALVAHLTSQAYKVTLKVVQLEDQKQFTAFVNPTFNEMQAFESLDKLVNTEHMQGTIVKNFN